MEESRKYETAKYIVGAAGFVLNTGLLIYLLTSGSTLRLRDFAERMTGSSMGSMVVLVYFAAVGVLFTVIRIPLDVFSGYYLEHRFGLSRQSLRGWIFDLLKGLALSAALGLVGMEIVYGLLRTHPDRWWIYTSLAFIGFLVVLTNLTPVLLLPLFFKFRPVENEDLRKRVDRLTRRIGTNVRGIFEWSLGEKTRKANAAVVGWGNTRRIIWA